MAAKIASIQAYRTLKECRALFEGYKARLRVMEKSKLLLELDKYFKEVRDYPGHLLTIAKGEALMGEIRKKSLTQKLQKYAAKEQKRLRSKVEERLYSH